MTRIDRYTCEQTFRLLDDWVDRELSDEEMTLASAHLETCEICAREYRFHTTMLQQVKQKLRRIDVSPDLLQRIQATLERERAGGPPQSE